MADYRRSLMHGAITIARLSPLVHGWLGGRLMACAVVALLSACNLGPRYQRPDVPPPAAWATEDAAAARQWPTSDWWRGFGSDDLNSFIAQAQLTNDDLRAAIARVREADAQRLIARAQMVLPLAA